MKRDQFDAAWGARVRPIESSRPSGLTIACPIRMASIRETRRRMSLWTRSRSWRIASFQYPQSLAKKTTACMPERHRKGHEGMRWRQATEQESGKEVEFLASTESTDVAILIKVETRQTKPLTRIVLS